MNITAIAIILIIVLWIIVGVWISYKRDWYRNRWNPSEQHFPIVGNVLFAPLCLVIALLLAFFIGDWDN